MYHIMIHNDTQKVAKSCSKVAQTFYCEKCDYSTSKKSSWKKHLETKKHKSTQMVHNDTSKVAKSCSININKWTCECGKTYKYHSGFYRHKAKCTYIVDTQQNPVINQSEENTDTEEHVMVSVEWMKTMMTAMSNALVENGQIGGGNNITTSGDNNTINNQKIFNVNLFLNEKCANAMSIQDFAKNLQLTMNDLDKSKPECITNIVLKNLKPMAITERPFHCADASTQEWYVKDQNKGWEEDDGEKVIQQTESGINKSWPRTFEEMHPNWKGNDKLQDKYVESSLKATQRMSSKNAKKVLNDIGLKATLNETVMKHHIDSKLES